MDARIKDILSGISTATITTVLLKKGLRNVWLRGAFPKQPGQKRVVGPAFTLRFVPTREDLATPASWASPISTRTAIVDTRTWAIDDNLETYTVTKDGRPYRASDINIWGVTFADDTRFYATLATHGRTYLVRGDVTARTLL